MSKNKTKKKKKGKNNGNKKIKHRKKKFKVSFSLDKEDKDGKEVVNDIIDRLKSVRKKVRKKNINDLRFASDILNVIGEVVTRYDSALSRGEFVNSASAQYIFRCLNYMLAAYQNIERMLAQDGYDFMDDFIKTRNLDLVVSKEKKDNKFESKFGSMGKQHIPLITKEKRKYTKKDKKKDKKKKKKKHKKNKNKNKKRGK